MSWPLRNSVDHDLQVMIDGEGGRGGGGEGVLTGVICASYAYALLCESCGAP